MHRNLGFRGLEWIILLSFSLSSCAERSPVENSPQPATSGWVKSSAVTHTVHALPGMLSKVVSFETAEGTFMSVDVSPDGETLTFDLLGDLYLLSISGGEAMPLTTGMAWDQAPRFSPDGKSVYFVSDRKGYKNIWRLMLSDKSARQVTASEGNVMGTPNWSQAGGALVVGRTDPETAGVEVTLHAVQTGSGELRPLVAPDGPWVDMDTFERFRDPIRTYSGVQAADGQLFFSESQFDEDLGRRVVRIYGFDPETQTRLSMTPPDAVYNEFKPQLSHDGKLLAYFRQYSDRRTEIRVLDRKTGSDDSLTELIDADDASYYASHDLWPNYAFTPDDSHIVFWQDGKIHQVALADGAGEIIPFQVKVEREVWDRVKPGIQKIEDTGEARIVRWPSLSQDSRTLVFAAIGYIWIMDVETGNLRRLTESSDFEYTPSLSPDGKSVAYVSFAQLEEGYGPARLMVADVNGGMSRELLTATNGVYLLPNWSGDGTKIALIRETTEAGDDGVQIETVFGWTDVDEGTFQEVASAPAASSRASLYLYARAVGFDQTGSTLWFSYPMSRKDTALAIVALDGSGLRTLAIGKSIGGITPAPGLKHLALTDLNGVVWVAPFDAGEDPIEMSKASADARRVSESGGYYVDWTHANQMTYGFARNLYRYDLGESALEVRPVKVTFEKPVPAQLTAFTGARLITISGGGGTGRVIESGTIVLHGNRITAVGPVDEVSVPHNAVVIDATGKTILPGLLDTHYHRIGGSGGPAAGLSAFKFPYPDFQDPSAIAYGVTAAWEPAGPPNDGSPATIDLQVAGRILGPRWSHSAVASVGHPYEHLTSYGAALAAVMQHKELGVDTLKEYNAPTREQRQWLSAAARDQGVGIVSHIDHFDGMMTRVVDGYTGGDHPYIPAPFYKDVHELLRQTGYIWTPNIVITPGTVGTGANDKTSYYWREVLEKRPNELEKLKAIAGNDRTIEEPSVPLEVHRVGRVAKVAAAAAKGGAHIGLSAHNMPGSGLHREMWYLWKGGLPAGDVLRAATLGNAEKLGLQEEIGSLEVGKVADILVLDENPLDDIINTLSLKYTVQGGVVYDSATAERVDVSSLAEVRD